MLRPLPIFNLFPFWPPSPQDPFTFFVVQVYVVSLVPLVQEQGTVSLLPVTEVVYKKVGSASADQSHPSS